MKKYLSLVLLVCALLAGCGGGDRNTDAPQESQSPAAADPADNRTDSIPTAFLYTTRENIIPMSESAGIDGVDCRVLGCELTEKFGDRKIENLNYFYGDGGIDDGGNLTNGSRYLFLQLEYTNTTDSELEILRGGKGVYSIDDRFIIQNSNLDKVYIDEYWRGGSESEWFHYKLAPGESVTCEVGWVIAGEMVNSGCGLYFALRMADCLSDSGGATDPEAILVELEY